MHVKGKTKMFTCCIGLLQCIKGHVFDTVNESFKILQGKYLGRDLLALAKITSIDSVADV